MSKKENLNFRLILPKKITGVGIILLMLGILFAVGGFLFLYKEQENKKFFKQFTNDFYANASSELISIAITVLIIDRLNQIRATDQEKKELILQMGSPINAVAIEAVRKLKVMGWVKDGSLKGANLKGADLSDADLSDADLRDSDLTGAKLVKTNFTNANLQGSTLENSDLTSSIFKGTKINSKTTLTKYAKLVWHIVNEAADGEDLSNIDLSYANLKGAKLNGVSLESAVLEGAILEGASLNRANLENSILNGADLTNVNLVAARLQNSKLQACTLVKTNFEEAILDGVDFLGSRMIDTMLSKSSLRGARLLVEEFSRVTTTEAKYNTETEWLNEPPPDAIADVVPIIIEGSIIPYKEF